MGRLNEQIDMDIKILSLFIEIYCQKKHSLDQKHPWTPKESLNFGVTSKPLLCVDCSGLMDYSLDRRLHCPLNPKPTCRNCEIHCYSGIFRDKIRKIMRFSGKRYLGYTIRRGLFKETLEILNHFI
jgi:hypothetical protein